MKRNITLTSTPEKSFEGVNEALKDARMITLKSLRALNEKRKMKLDYSKELAQFTLLYNSYRFQKRMAQYPVFYSYQTEDSRFSAS